MILVEIFIGAYFVSFLIADSCIYWILIMTFMQILWLLYIVWILL